MANVKDTDSRILRDIRPRVAPELAKPIIPLAKPDRETGTGRLPLETSIPGTGATSVPVPATQDAPVRYEWVDPDQPLTWSRPLGWAGGRQNSYLKPSAVVDYSKPFPKIVEPPKGFFDDKIVGPLNQVRTTFNDEFEAWKSRYVGDSDTIANTWELPVVGQLLKGVGSQALHYTPGVINQIEAATEIGRAALDWRELKDEERDEIIKRIETFLPFLPKPVKDSISQHYFNLWDGTGVAGGWRNPDYVAILGTSREQQRRSEHSRHLAMEWIRGNASWGEVQPQLAKNFEDRSLLDEIVSGIFLDPFFVAGGIGPTGAIGRTIYNVIKNSPRSKDLFTKFTPMMSDLAQTLPHSPKTRAALGQKLQDEISQARAVEDRIRERMPITSDEVIAEAGGVGPYRDSVREEAVHAQIENMKNISNAAKEAQDRLARQWPASGVLGQAFQWPPSKGLIDDIKKTLRVDLDTTSLTAAGRQLSQVASDAAVKAVKLEGDLLALQTQAVSRTIKKGLELLKARTGRRIPDAEWDPVSDGGNLDISGAGLPSATERLRRYGDSVGADLSNTATSHEALAVDLDYPHYQNYHTNPRVYAERTNELQRAGLRNFEAARNKQEALLSVFKVEGDELLKKAGLNPQEITEEQMKPVFQVLHGEKPPEAIPPNLIDVFHHVDALRKDEARIHAEFLSVLSTAPGSQFIAKSDMKNISEYIMTHPDYFKRGWTKESLDIAYGHGGTFAPTGHLRKRHNATFTDMVDGGLVPETWNPVHMMVASSMERNNFREASVLWNYLRAIGRLKPEQEVVNVRGWRVPKIEPFQSPKRVDQNGEWLPVQNWAVDGYSADAIDQLYRVPTDIPLVDGVLTTFKMLKRLRLKASLYQHVDILARYGAGETAGAALHGKIPIGAPSQMAEMVEGMKSSMKRKDILKDILESNEPLFVHNGTPIHARDMMDAGTQFGGDTSIYDNHIKKFLEGYKEHWGIRRVPRKQIQMLDDVIHVFERGLLGAMYPLSMKHTLAHFLLPAVSKARPYATARQVALEASENVNLMYSSLPVWQSVINNPLMRKTMDAFFFSPNEAESLSRIFARGFGFTIGPEGWMNAIPTREGGRWVKGLPIGRSPYSRRMLGVYLGIIVNSMIMGNVINYAVTGKMMPWQSYYPTAELSDPYGWFGPGTPSVDFSRWLSPTVTKSGGRGATVQRLEMMGQFTGAGPDQLEGPIRFFTNRLNLPQQAINHQLQGKNFYGQSVKDDSLTKQLFKRGIMAGTDLIVPFNATGLMEMFRGENAVARDVIGVAEDRLGWTGHVLQMFGLNIRAEKSNEIALRIAKGLGWTQTDGTPIETIEDFEKKHWSWLKDDPETLIEQAMESQQGGGAEGDELEKLIGEFQQRRSESAERGQEWAQKGQELQALEDEKIHRQRSLEEEFQVPDKDVVPHGRWDAQEFRTRLGMINLEISVKQSDLFESKILTLDELDEDPNKRALQQNSYIYQISRRHPESVELDNVKVSRLLRMMRRGEGVPEFPILEEGWTAAQTEYVKANTQLGKNTPTVQRYYDAIEMLQPYFEIEDQVHEELGTQGLADEYESKTNETERMAHLMRHPELRDAQAEIRIQQGQWFQTSGPNGGPNVEADKEAWIWGFVSRPTTDEIIERRYNAQELYMRNERTGESLTELPPYMSREELTGSRGTGIDAKALLEILDRIEQEGGRKTSGRYKAPGLEPAWRRRSFAGMEPGELGR